MCRRKWLACQYDSNLITWFNYVCTQGSLTCLDVANSWEHRLHIVFSLPLVYGVTTNDAWLELNTYVLLLRYHSLEKVLWDQVAAFWWHSWHQMITKNNLDTRMLTSCWVRCCLANLWGCAESEAVASPANRFEASAVALKTGNLSCCFVYRCYECSYRQVALMCHLLESHSLDLFDTTVKIHQMDTT